MKGMMATWLTLVLAGIVSAQQPQFNDFSATSGPMPDRSEFGSSYTPGSSASTNPDYNRSLAPRNAQLTLAFDLQSVSQLQADGQLTSYVDPNIVSTVNEIVFGFAEPINQSVHSGDYMPITPLDRVGDTIVFEFSESHLKALERQTLRYRYSNDEIGKYRRIVVTKPGARTASGFDSTAYRSPLQQEPFTQNPLTPNSADRERFGSGSGGSSVPLTPLPSSIPALAGSDRSLPSQGYTDNSRLDPRPTSLLDRPFSTTDRFATQYKQDYLRDSASGIASELERERANQRRAEQLARFSDDLTYKAKELELKEQQLKDRLRQVSDAEQNIRAAQQSVVQDSRTSRDWVDPPYRQTDYRDQRDGQLNNNQLATNLPANTIRDRWASTSELGTNPVNQSLEVRKLNAIYTKLDDLERENQKLRNELLDTNEVARNLQYRLASSDLPSQQAKSASPLRGFQASIGGANDAQRENQLINNNMSGPLFFMLCCSLGLNVYLGWISRNFYVRYNELADELRETFSASIG